MSFCSLRSGLVLPALLLWLAATDALAAPARTPDEAVISSLARLEKAFAGRELYGDGVFLVTQAARARGRVVKLTLRHELVANKDVFPYSLEYLLWEMREAHLPRVPVRLPGILPLDPSAYRAQGGDDAVLADAREQAKWVILVMSNALLCDQAMVAVDLVGQPGNEYIVTHQVLGLLLGDLRGCLKAGLLPSSLPAYVARVRDEFVAEQSRGAFTDLQFERAAILCMVGRCDLVPRSFIVRLQRAQGADGLWRPDDPLIRGKVIPPEHASALAYYVLAHARH